VDALGQQAVGGAKQAAADDDDRRGTIAGLDVLGASQSGRRSSLRLLSVLRDEGDIVTARRYADEMVLGDPSLGSHPGLAAAVEELVATEQAEYMEKS